MLDVPLLFVADCKGSTSTLQSDILAGSVSENFSAFLSEFIQRNNLRKPILERVKIVWVSYISLVYVHVHWHLCICIIISCVWHCNSAYSGLCIFGIFMASFDRAIASTPAGQAMAGPFFPLILDCACALLHLCVQCCRFRTCLAAK